MRVCSKGTDPEEAASFHRKANGIVRRHIWAGHGIRVGSYGTAPFVENRVNIQIP